MKYWIIFLVVLLLGTNGFWVFVLIDDAVTCAYSDSSFELTEKMYRQSVVLANLELIGKTANEAVEIIGKDVYGLEPFIKEGCVYAGQVCVRLNENNIVEGIGENAL